MGPFSTSHVPGGGPRSRNSISIATHRLASADLLGPRANRVTCSPVVFNDIKHLTATCDRRARFRHPVTARGSSHALLPWALPRERTSPHICNDINGLAPDDRRVHRTPQPAPGRRAQHSKHFLQAPAARCCPP